MPLDKAQAQTAIKNIWGEASSLSPSSLVQLFEIDLSSIGFSQGVISQNEINSNTNIFFRFHNSVKLTNSSIIWRKNEYIAAPINAEGFEVTSRGTLPTPKLSLTVSDDGIPHLTMLKERILQLGDLVGAKVTRIRTFAKFLDAENFFGTVAPVGFEPNPNSEFPRDVFYIERKSLENKNIIEYELSSLLDLEGLKSPGRLVVSNSCPFQYRGEGCMYEYNSRRIEATHGTSDESTLLEEAPPVATVFDEYIPDLLSGAAFIDRGEYNSNMKYSSGDYVFVQHNNLNYYFIAKGVDITTPPPNINYWVQDNCSRRIRGCEYRYAVGGSAVGVTLGNVPYGGWLSVNRFK